MTTAFVLSGGCSLGASQVGMLQALSDRRVVPDLLVGTSSGALNALYVAERGCDRAAADGLADVWCALRRRDLFPVDLRQVARVLAGAGGSVCPDRGIRALVASQLRHELLEDAAIPVHVVATDLLSGQEVLISDGPAAEAVLASCALPGVLPSMERDGHVLVDGGLADNTAISQAAALGADRIYVLPAGYACARPEAPRTPVGHAVQALSLVTHQRLLADIVRYAGELDLVVLPPPCPLRISPLDFRHARDLIGRSYRDATHAMSVDGGVRRHPERDVALHGHDRGQAPSNRSSLASSRLMSALVADSRSGRRSTTIVPPGSSLT